MNIVKLMFAIRRIPPQAWDAIIPHGPPIGGGFGRGRGIVELNGQPTPPRPDPMVAAAEMARDLARVASSIESTGGGGADAIIRMVDDWCGTPWPHHWPWPVPFGGEGDPEPRPNWDVSMARVVGGLVLAETASRMLDGDLREAMATGAEKLLEVGMG